MVGVIFHPITPRLVNGCILTYKRQQFSKCLFAISIFPFVTSADEKCFRFFISMGEEQSKHEAYWQRELIATVNMVFYDHPTQHNLKRRLNLLLTVCATFSANNLFDLF